MEKGRLIIYIFRINEKYITEESNFTYKTKICSSWRSSDEKFRINIDGDIISIRCFRFMISNSEFDKTSEYEMYVEN